jgi:hypothetical protein
MPPSRPLTRVWLSCCLGWSRRKILVIFFPYTAAFATCVKLLLMGLPLRAPHATREVFNRPEVAGTSAVEYLQKIAVHRSIMFGYVWTWLNTGPFGPDLHSLKGL